MLPPQKDIIRWRWPKVVWVSGVVVFVVGALAAQTNAEAAQTSLIAILLYLPLLIVSSVNLRRLKKKINRLEIELIVLDTLERSFKAVK